MSVCPVGDNISKNQFVNSRPAVTQGEKKVYPAQNPDGTPNLRTESCNVTNNIQNTTGGTDVPNGTSTSTTVEKVQTAEAKQGWGFKWESTWAPGNAYVMQSDEHPLASTVFWNGTSYVCIQDHISEYANSPVPPDNAMEMKGEWAEGEVYTAYSSTHKASTVTYEGASWICTQDHISEIANSPVDGGDFWARLDADNGSDGSGTQYWEVFSAQGASGSGSALPSKDKSYLEQLKDFKDNVFDWIENADLKDWLQAGAIAAGIIWAGSKVMDMMQGDGEGDGNASTTYNGSAGYAGAYSAPNLPTVVASLCDYAGIIYDVSALPQEAVEFTVASNTSIRSILEQLSLAYQFDMVNSGGILKFVPRNADAIKTITLEDMGFSSSETPPAPYTAKRYQGVDLPRYVAFTYYSAALDYAQYTQSAELYTYEDGQNVSLSVPVTLSDTRAKQIAELALINSHLERMNYKFSTTYKFISVEPGDILNSPMGLIRILKVTEVDEGVLEFEACDAGSDAALSASNQNIQAPTTPSAPAISTSLGYSGAFWLDPTNLNDQDTGVRVYAAPHGFGRAGWPGAAIYMSEDGGLTYEQIGTASQEATLGIVETATSSADYHVWDETTQITVKLNSGSLLSKSELAVLNGDNWAMIGQEIIGFKNATLIAEKTYRLTGLLRGRQGTEQYVGTHQANELFCLINSALIKIDLADSDRGTTKKFKVVTIGSSLDKADAEDVHIVSNNTRMWPVYNPVIALQGQDWVISWRERVRFDNQIKDFATTNHDPDWAGFGVAILDADGKVKSSYVVQGTSVTYTAAQQVTDFGTLQAGIKVSIVQMSQKWGGGYPTVINN
jgi:hypothetical protein